MLAALLLAVQATPEGVAARDAAELIEMLTGTWNNAEAVYFAREMGDPVPEPHWVQVAPDGQGGLTYREGPGLGAYAASVPLTITTREPSLLPSAADEPCEVYGTRSAGDGFLLTRGGPGCDGVLPESVYAVLTADSITDDGALSLRRADPYTCWVSRKKEADGWTWTPDVRLHEGGYVQMPEEAGVTRPAGIRLRHVRWPYGRNRDSLVLYVHEAEEEPALSYAWTEPDGERVAINLRWVQASCTRDEG